jgi:hypothetical protein
MADFDECGFPSRFVRVARFVALRHRLR